MLTACIVTYHNNKEELHKAMFSFLNTDMNVKLYIIDNSTNRSIESLCLDNRIEYVYNNKNLGFGAGHNIAINKSISDGSIYHLILNPDITFSHGVTESLLEYMENNQDVGIVMPRVLYPDGKLQRLCKLIPTPLDFFIRRFVPIQFLKDKINSNYELWNFDYNSILEIPILSGCFMFCKTDAIFEVGGFDDRYFMYLEDFDLCRRVGQKYKTVYNPVVSIIHRYERGAYKNKKLLYYFLSSTIKYFNKWGWFFDKERNINNVNTLKNIKEDRC